MDELNGRQILLGVSGSIAIAKSLELLSQLKKAGAAVRVAMTDDATRMIAPVTYEALTEHPVYASMWGTARSYEMEHLSWSKWAELMLVAPATATTLAAIAHGTASNAVTSTALALEGKPLVVCPAMNPAMFAAAATQANLATLRARGVRVCGPIAGLTACGDVGLGRMSEVPATLEFVRGVLREEHGHASGRWRGKRVLLTAGPTREAIDAVRFLSNASTGKMGFELAAAAARRGAEVDLICGPTPIAPPCDPAIRVHRVTTAVEMHAAAMRAAPECQVAIFTAAVADFRPANAAAQKVKKSEIDAAALALVPNPDIAEEVGKLDVPGQLRVGFAAETHNVEEYARRKLEAKNLHLIVANDVSAAGVGFGSDENAVTIFARDGGAPLVHAQASKRDIAEKILDAIEEKFR